MPVQYVVRPHREEYHDYRGYAGSVASGVLYVGQRVRIMPSGMESAITNIEAPWGSVEEACAPDAVTVQIADDLDVTRGEMICGADNGAGDDPGARRSRLLDGRAHRASPR